MENRNKNETQRDAGTSNNTGGGSNGNNSGNNSNGNNTRNLQDLKAETAKELGIDLSQGGSLSSRDAGRVGGNMVRKMTQEYKQNHPEE